MRRSQEEFQRALEGGGDPHEDAVAAALCIYDFARAAPGDARLLASLRREDLIQMPLPDDVAAELAQLNAPIEAAMVALTRRLFGRAGKERVSLVVLATFDLPNCALRRHLLSGRAPPAALRPALARAVRAALETTNPEEES